MNLLLDTHSFLWFIENNPKLNADMVALIKNRDNDVFLSTVSLWEIAIKSSLGKLQLGMPFRLFVLSQVSLNNINLLDIAVRHIEEVAILPFHHKDPFDRLLIAQATVEQMPIISLDTTFDAYGVTRIW